MKNSFIDLLRQPDSILFQYEDSDIRFEEPVSREEQSSKIDYIVENGAGKVILYPADKAVKRVKLRWRGDMSDVLMVMGDDYDRGMGNIKWIGLTPERQMPWYFHAFDGERLNCFGVKTGANAFCFFQCDPCGITLWIDVRNGGGGVNLSEPLHCVSVVCRMGKDDETPYMAAQSFCNQMCDNPNLPDEPIFGVNNWYWAYGKISHESIMTETDHLLEMCRDSQCRPYMIIDDGWQVNRFTVQGQGYYNGGPWHMPNSNFKGMDVTCDAIHSKGAKAGIWFRPLKTCVQHPEEMFGPARYDDNGLVMDPSHPGVLEIIAKDVAMIRGWGYDLIKHDFTTWDTMKLAPGEDDGRHFYDKTVTNCQMLKRLYTVIQENAGGANVIGCNTINHITAGIHQSQRTGADTSGRSFEITRMNGGEAMIRLPQNNTFFSLDPDCAAFTDMVDASLNLDFLEMYAVSGVVTLASVTPGILTPEQMKRIQGIYRIASQGGLGAVPTDWLGHNTMSSFETPDGRKFNFDWYRVHEGVRTFYGWYR